MNSQKTLFVIDVYNLIYRMFYAIPEITTREGAPVNAIFGVAKFLKALADENPDASLVVATDHGKNFREDLYPEYKAQRERMPDNLRTQIEGVFSLFDTAGIPTITREGYEADDIIGSIACEHQGDEYQIVIISSDKDLCQFVRDGHVHIFDAMKRKFMKEADVLEKFAVPVNQVRDYLAIVGDASDNIPGIKGFGPKKAETLLKTYGTLENIYEHIAELPQKMQEVLVAERENAFLSQKLATIITDLDIDEHIFERFSEKLGKREYLELLKKYEFRSLLPKDAFLTQKVSLEHVVKDIQSYEELGVLIQEMNSTPSDIGIAFGNDTNLIISFQSMIYRINTQIIDSKDLATSILDGKNQIIGFDLKYGLKKLLSLKNPQKAGDGIGQGSLF